MKNAGLAGAIALCGIGLMMIGLGNFVKAPTAMAYTPAITTTVQDKGEPTIVWYGTQSVIVGTGSNSCDTDNSTNALVVFRAWSNGLIEYRAIKTFERLVMQINCDGESVDDLPFCTTSWRVFSAPTEGLNAAADITFDEVVDGQDLATLLASWGEAPRNPMPPSDCPLGLMN